MGCGLCGEEGLLMYTQDLKHALTQPYTSTSCAFTVIVGLWLPCEKVNALFSLCISVNCIMANQLMFSTEQGVFMYDQYLLT